MMNDEVLQVVVATTDAERKAVGKCLRKYRPMALRKRLFWVGVAVWSAALVLWWLFYDQFRQGAAGVNDIGMIFHDETGEYTWPAEEILNHFSYAVYSLIGMFVLLTWHTVWLCGSAWRANFRSLNGREFVYEISAQGFSSREAGIMRVHYSWAGVERVVREDVGVLLFLDVCVAVYVPWRAFASAEEGERFFARAQQWHREAAAKIA